MSLSSSEMEDKICRFKTGKSAKKRRVLLISVNGLKSTEQFSVRVLNIHKAWLSVQARASAFYWQYKTVAPQAFAKEDSGSCLWCSSKLHPKAHSSEACLEDMWSCQPSDILKSISRSLQISQDLRTQTTSHGPSPRPQPYSVAVWTPFLSSLQLK